jgi:steroid delta-isomerase-like uncharacterized protein
MTDPHTELALTQIATAFAADWTQLQRLYAEDVRYSDPDGELSGRDAVLQRLREQVEALPGSGYRIRHTYSDGGTGVVVEWTLSGDEGMPIELAIATVYDFLDDRIVSERNYWDNAALLGQLGALPAATAGQ